MRVGLDAGAVEGWRAWLLPPLREDARVSAPNQYSWEFCQLSVPSEINCEAEVGPLLWQWLWGVGVAVGVLAARGLSLPPSRVSGLETGVPLSFISLASHRRLVVNMGRLHVGGSRMWVL